MSIGQIRRFITYENSWSGNVGKVIGEIVTLEVNSMSQIE